MTIRNRALVNTYRDVFENYTAHTLPKRLAMIADQMAVSAFDTTLNEGIRPISDDAMMDIEASIFAALCHSNGINWRDLEPFG
jgi:hypothetical protein